MAIDKTIEDTANQISKAIVTYLEKQEAAANKVINDKQMAEMMKKAISDALKENGLSQEQGEQVKEAVKEKVERELKVQEEEVAQEEALEPDGPEIGEGQDSADLDHGFPEGSIGEALAQENAAAGLGQSQGLGVDIPPPSVGVGL